MTKKEAREALQAEINTEAMSLYVDACNEVRDYCSVHQLRSCQAYVYETDHFIALKSFSTLVAFIDKRTNIMYNVLRKVYGYTAVSNQHISKFKHDYYTIECIVAK